MSEELYQRAIKEIAQAGWGAGRLEQPSVTVRLDNPLCGDRITLDLIIEDCRVTAIALETKGCLLCRAAAAIIGRDAPGRAVAELAAAHAELASFLKGDNAAPPGWPDLATFTPVRLHSSRHACALLPFRALREALDAS